MENLPTDTQLFETFREVFGNEKAERAVNTIKNMTHMEMASQTQTLATSKQLSALEIATSRQLSAFEKQLSAFEAANNKQLSAFEKQLSAFEAANNERFSALEIRLIDRIHKSQFQIVFWIVSIGVLQFIASYMLNNG